MMRELVKWIDEIVSEYRIGDTIASDDSKTLLNLTLKKFYAQTGKDVLKFDVRQRKQLDEEELIEALQKEISAVMSNLYDGHRSATVQNVSKTAGGFIKNTTVQANAEGMGTIEAKRTLTNYLRNHTTMIAMSESQWAVEGTRYTASMIIDKEMKKAADIVTMLLETGMISAAIEKAQEFFKLSGLPLTETQENLMNVIIDNTKKVVDPITGQEEINSIKDEADALGYTMKRWETIGDGKVRATHQAANGQTVPREEPFIVGGYRLRWPGDGGLGADLSELVNCRCASVFVEG